MEMQPGSSFLAGEFWGSVLRSETFWVPQDHGALLGTLALALALLTTMLLLPRLSRHRRRISELHRDPVGSVTMLDFVMVAPLFVFFMFVVFQFAILAKNHLFTHYAAYMAARSARVYLCPQIPLSTGAFLDVQLDVKVCDSDAAAQKADTAARIALIPAAPYKTLPCQSGCQAPEAVLRNVAEAAGVSKRWGAIQRQARYTFDKQNVTVTIGFAPMATYAAAKRIPHMPVKATVAVRFLLLDYAGWVMADGKRKDGRYYTVSRAEVTLL
ncbi:TadE/TadG family type IV pilus assembly protein [Mesorhizobium sp. KR1-2]|uniref:TadE/TadG family type IV pilus assembly protein n=1 Tax=Mesorhizobium sp. KR1-2 TaxID=3156609 RepID=UPI0032B58211